MRALRPSELFSILHELQKQKLRDEYNDLRGHWAFLAAVITNGLSSIAAMFAKRKPKRVTPDDFISKDFKRLVEQTTEARPAKETGWASHIQDAKEKGLKGPW